MRFRGKTTGPFSLAQIEQMRQLGRVTGFHEVSLDGVNWILAADAGLVASTSTSQNTAPVMPTMILPMEPAPTTDPTWYHLDASGDRQGPFSREQLTSMIAGGRLVASSEVWCEGFADWVALDQTDLAGFLPQKQAAIGKGTTMLVRTPTTTAPGGNGLVVAGYLCCVASLFLCPGLGIPALVCAIMNLTRRRVSHGLAQMFLSIVLSSAGSFLWYLFLKEMFEPNP